MALGKKAIQNSQFQSHGPTLAVDGSLETTMHSLPSDTPKWWQVNLGDSHHVIYAIIYNAIQGTTRMKRWFRELVY